MAKSLERNKAINLRKNGESIKKIAKLLRVSKSSVSLWCENIRLTQRQKEKLHERMVSGSYFGRMAGARMQHEFRIKRAISAEISGVKDIGKLSDRELLIALVALYWGEGAKKKREFSLNNSDPEMVKFLMKIFRKVLKIEESRIVLRVGINVIHKGRDKEIKKYWSEVTGVSEVFFRKTTFIKAKNRKKYENFKNHYGTIRINIKKSIDIYYRMLGLIKGLIEGV